MANYDSQFATWNVANYKSKFAIWNMANYDSMFATSIVGKLLLSKFALEIAV